MSGYRPVRLPRAARSEPERPRAVPAWRAWCVGKLVYLGSDHTELFAVIGHEGTRVVVESLDTGDRKTIGPSRLTEAAGGDAAVLRHAWPLGTEVHYWSALHEVVGHVACPGLWFGRLRLRPLGGGEEICTTTDAVAPRMRAPHWMRPRT
ncbi:hypothetical protein J0910_14225 [Nocardiopsis sp. CNT-189]|uniref:hypothetical protein n=1 Tax=Nocardiopsis oceanisediminis TaxID=2816862 RepID=UPI003B349759